MIWWLLILIAILGAWSAMRFRPLIERTHLEPLSRFHSSLAADRHKVVICLGDSLTRGNRSFDYVDLLGRRLEPSGYTVLNAGTNGALAWNLLQRVDRVIACEPAWVVLMVGTHDARGSENKREGARYARRMKLPQGPDESFFRTSFSELLDRLSSGCRSRVVLLTLPPLGERGGAPIDRYVERFNEFIEEQAAERGLDLLPVGRVLRERLLAHPSETAPIYGASASNSMGIRALIHRYLLGWDWNRISTRHEMRLLTDMIHFNGLAGEIVVEQVEHLIRTQTPTDTNSEIAS